MIRQADCIEAMRELDEASVDAVVCDPPYGLEFMGKEWDALEAKGRGAKVRERRATERTPDGSGHSTSKGPYLAAGVDWQGVNQSAMQEWHHAWATEALRVLKPGGHLLAFGGTRTYHRLACAIEDAGFEIRDCLVWMYGSGFPKSLDVSKAIDKAAGVEREVVGKSARHIATGEAAASNLYAQDDWTRENGRMGEFVTAPATPEAQRWQGWGTALKPAHEPIVLARKPLAGTVAQNCLTHGTGALNVDGCRVESGADYHDLDVTQGLGGPPTSYSPRSGPRHFEPASGRWPANVTLDPEAAAMLDEQSGERPSGVAVQRNGGGGQIFGAERGAAMRNDDWGYGDTGGASRFYYCAKASRAERNAGLAGFEAKPYTYNETTKRCAVCGCTSVRGDAKDKGIPSMACGHGDEHIERIPYQREGSGLARNSHPTVKPISLMRWLCRLVTPPGGLILDPFTGSGTTGCAAVLEGFRFLGVEREEEYAAIAEARIEWWAEHRGREAEEVLADSRKSEVERERHAGAGQLGFEIE